MIILLGTYIISLSHSTLRYSFHRLLAAAVDGNKIHPGQENRHHFTKSTFEQVLHPRSQSMIPQSRHEQWIMYVVMGNGQLTFPLDMAGDHVISCSSRLKKSQILITNC